MGEPMEAFVAKRSSQLVSTGKPSFDLLGRSKQSLLAGYRV